MTAVLGVDLGATSTKAVVGGPDGTIGGRAARATPQGPDGEAVTAGVLETIRTACADAGLAPADLAAAGVGSLGPLDRSAGAVAAPPNLPVDRVPLVDPIEELIEAEVGLYNDAAAAALGERFYGPGDGLNLVYLTISTGIGAGAIVDGHLLAGREGNACEVGHLALDPDGPRLCGCGGAGHWEGFCAGGNLADHARWLAAEADVGTALDLEDLDAPTLFGAAEGEPPGGPGGDPLAGAVLERAARFNALGVAAIVHAYDPAVVAVGGGVAVNNPAAVLDPVRDRLPDLVLRDPPAIRLATKAGDAVVTGALASALTRGTGRA